MQNPNIHKLLSALRNVHQVDGESWTSYCPIHESGPGTHTNSLSIKAGDDGKILVNCHNQCSSKDIIYSCGLSWADCFVKEVKESASRITATYNYEDEDGVLRFQVVRLEPGKEGRAKDFRQRVPDGNGGFTWKTKGLQKFPYRLRELAAAPKDKPVFNVEGEKQVDYLREKHGLIATCNPGGAGKWLKSYAKYFADRDVIVIPDCDPPNEKTGKIVGAAHAKDVADSMIGVAKSIHVIELPGCQPKDGLDDWLEKRGHTLEELSSILREAKEWGPESSIVTQVPVGQSEEEMADPLAMYSRILEECGITYVAQHDTTGFIEIFSECTQKFTIIRDPAKLAYEQLALAGGIRIAQKVRRTGEDNGDYSLAEVKNAIAMVASQNSALDEKVGVGIWENNDTLIVVKARQLGVLNGKPELQITSNPVQYGTAYDIGDRCNWIDLDRLQADIARVQAKPGELYVDDVFRLQELFSLWNYTTKNNVFPQILTGMLLATFVQTTLPWRPQVYITGKSYAGKTTMMRMVSHIFGPLSKLSSNSSAAGIRQTIGTSGRIAMCDELEKSRHRKDILEMIRSSGRGDDSFRGTANHNSVSFSLKHIFWCGSIETGLVSEADQSRFIVVELGDNRKKLEIPTNDELNELGKRLASVSICALRRARELAMFLLANHKEDIHGRVCESYAVPIAMYSAAIGFSDPEALILYEEALRSISAADQVESDSEALLQEILMAKIRTGSLPIVESTVINLIETRLLNDNEIALNNNGIFFHDDFVLLNRVMIQKELLKGSEWRDRRLDTLLGRLPGAERMTKRFGASVMRFVAIPRSTISSVDLESDSKPKAPSFEDQAKGLFAPL